VHLLGLLVFEVLLDRGLGRLPVLKLALNKRGRRRFQVIADLLCELDVEAGLLLRFRPE
jgi:hypothetical protein